MNIPVPVSTNLPAHLKELAGMANFGAAVVGGISVGKAHPRISIKQNRFRIISEQGQEFVVPALHLDVIVVGVNEHVSKMYYPKAYSTADGDQEAPACFSDNGMGPSTRSSTPQAATCAACPHHVWGSKVTPSGSKIRACADSKKLAVILADNPGGLVYELRVPAASLENLKGLAETLEKRGEILPSMVLRLSFDETSQFPKLNFTPTSYINEAQKNALLEVFDGEEAKECVGKDDVAIDPNLPRIATAPVATAPIPVPPVQAAPSAFTPPMMPMPQPAAYQPQSPGFNPMAAQAQAAPQAPQAPAFNPMAPQMTPPGAAPAPTTPRRTRRTKAQMAATEGLPTGVAQSPMTPTPQVIPQTMPPVMQAAPAPVTYAVPAGVAAAAAPHPVQPNFQVAQPVQGVATANAALDIPAFLRRDHPGMAPPAASVPTQPAQTNAALDDIIKGAMA